MAFHAAGMKQGKLATLGPATWKRGFRAFKEGFRQHRTQGNPWQQGGVLVVDRGGKLLYAYSADSAGDHPPIGDVLGALPAPVAA